MYCYSKLFLYGYLYLGVLKPGFAFQGDNHMVYSKFHFTMIFVSPIPTFDSRCRIVTSARYKVLDAHEVQDACALLK